MTLLKPETVAEIKRFDETIGENNRFYLTGIRTVTVNAKDFGKGEMVLLQVQGHDQELGIWGQYLLEQAKAAEPSDLNKWYVITRGVVDGYSNKPVKQIAPARQPEHDDIPF